MLKSSKQLISLIMSFFLCFSSLNTTVFAEEETGYEADNTAVAEVVEEEPEEASEETVPEEVIPEEEQASEESPEEVSVSEELPEEEKQEENVPEDEIPEEQEDPEEPALETEAEPEELSEDEHEIYAESAGFTYTLNGDNAIISGYTGSDKDITIPSSLDGYTVTEIGNNAFRSSTNIQSVTFEGSLSIIGNYAFQNCTALSQIDLPEGLLTIGLYAFYGCRNLKTISIPASVSSIGEKAFESAEIIIFEEGMSAVPDSACSGARNLKTVTMPDTVTSLGAYAFSNCGSLESVSLSENLVTIGNSCFNKCTSLQEIIFPNTVQTVGDYAFTGCTALSHAELGSGLKTLGYYVFRDCRKLKKITIPASLTTAHSGDFELLEEADFEEGTTEIVSSLFSGSEKLVKISFPSTLQKIKSSAFYGCKSLSSVEIPDNVELEGYVFANCTSLERVVMGNHVTIGEMCFQNCSAVRFFETGEDLTINEDYSFYGFVIKGNCTDQLNFELDMTKRLLTLSGTGEIPDYSEEDPSPWCGLYSWIEGLQINEGITAVGNESFTGAGKLEFADLPESLFRIGNNSFSECVSLNYVDIPENVAMIGDGAFEGCAGLEKVVFGGNAPMIGLSSFDRDTDFKVYIPDTAAGWSNAVFESLFSSLDKRVLFQMLPYGIGVTLLLDISDSMVDDFDLLKESVCEFIDRIGGRYNKIDLSVIAYDNNAKLVSEFSTNISRLKHDVMKMKLGQGTQYNPALNYAYSYVKNNSRAEENYIVMFSDGEPKDNLNTIYQTAAMIRESYPIFAIYVSNSFVYQSEVLQTIAGDDSHYFGVGAMNALTNTFIYLAGELWRGETTTVDMYRNGIEYDLTGDTERNIIAGSQEEVTITVKPAFDIGDYLEVCLEQNGEKILSNEKGSFRYIQPGLLFELDAPIDAVTYYRDGTEAERIRTSLKVSNEVEVRYHMNDGTGHIYKTEKVSPQNDFKAPSDPERYSYVFKGWYASSACTGYSFFSTENTNNRKYLSQDVDLYAKWVTYTTGRDNLSFLNDSSIFVQGKEKGTHYEMKKGDLNKLLNLYPKKRHAEIIKEKNSTWGGSCFGMSSVSVLAFYNKLSISSFRGKNYADEVWENVFDAELYENKKGDQDVDSLESMINFYHLRQFLPSYLNAFNKAKDRDESDDLKSIISKLNASNGGPCLLNVFLFIIDLDDDSVSTGYHSVVAHHMTQVDQNTWEILIYDCACSSERDYVLTIKKKQNGIYTKECPEWLRAWGAQDIKMVNAHNVDDLVKYKILTAPNTLSKGQSAEGSETDSYYLETCYGSFRLTDGTHTAIIKNGDLVTADFSVDVFGQFNTIYEDPKYIFYLPVPESGYYEVFPDNEEENHSTVLNYENETNGFYAAVQTSGDGSQKFFSDGTVQTVFNTPSEQTVLVSGSQTQTSWNTIEITTVSKGLTVSPSAEKTTVTSEDETVMSISADTDFNTVAYDNIPVSSAAVEIIESSDGKCTVRCGEEILSEKLFGYSVIFDSGLGTDVPSLQNVEKGSLLSIPESPRRSGYFFEGWYKDEDYTEKWNFETDTIQEDTVLYAGWSLDPNYFITVTFKIAGMPDQIVTLINGYPLSENDCPNAGYGDMEWFTDSRCLEPWKFGDILRHHMILYSEGYDRAAVDAVEIETGSTIVNQGETLQMNAVFTPEDAVKPAVKWTSSDEAVAAVDQNGLVTGIKAGKAVITVITLNGKTAETEITVKRAGGIEKPVTSVALNRSFVYLMPGETLSLKATVLPTDADDRDLTWSSSDDAVASVDRNGTITAAGLGKAVITAVSVNGHSDSCTVTVQEEEVREGIYFKNLETSYTYTGSAIKPIPEVYDSGVLLTAGKDYTVTYKNNTNAYKFEGERDSYVPVKGDKTPYILITGKGNYSGKTYVPFSITQIDLNDPDQVYVEETITLKANNKVQRPVPVITFNGKVLSSKEYRLTYLDSENNPLDKKTGPKAAGTYTIVVTGNGKNFTGEKEIPLTIAEETVKAKTTALSKALTITTVSGVYDGEEHTNAVIASKATYELTEGKDYTVAYTKNVNAGTATVTATGKGIYTGTVKKTFKITPRMYSEHTDEFNIEVSDAVYSKGGAVPEVHVYWNDSELKAGTDYTLKYANNKKVTDSSVSKKPTVTITFKGNFKGTDTEEFSIDPKPIDQVNITAKDKVYSSKANGWKSAPVLKDTDGKTLKAGTDYEKTITYTTADGKELPAVVEADTVVKVTVTGKGSYTGTATTTYRILKTGNDISKMTFKINDKEYTGSAVTITEDDILSIKSGKNELDLKLGTDYEIVSYTNNIKKGTAKVILRGLDGYGGEKTVTFKIGQRSINDYWNGIMSFFNHLF